MDIDTTKIAAVSLGLSIASLAIAGFAITELNNFKSEVTRSKAHLIERLAERGALCRGGSPAGWAERVNQPYLRKVDVFCGSNGQQNTTIIIRDGILNFKS